MEIYVYDVENRLVVKTTGTVATSLRYDPLGRLYELVDPASGTTRFLHDGDALVGECNASDTQLARYGHGPLAGVDDPLVSYAGTSVALANARFLYPDPRGSIVLAANSSGAATATNTYDEYGIPGSANAGRFQYTGQVWLPELGLYYYKARMYSPTLGRFMQTDPIGYADNANLYAYVGNDPVNWSDPSGLAGLKKPPAPDGTDECNPPACILVNGVRYYGPTAAATARLTAGLLINAAVGGLGAGWGNRTKSPTGCQKAFLTKELEKRGLPSDQVDNIKFVSGLDANANSFTREAFRSVNAVTQGNTIYVQPDQFDEFANFRSPKGFEKVYHTAQFAMDGKTGFYARYGMLSFEEPFSAWELTEGICMKQLQKDLQKNPMSNRRKICAIID